MRGSRPGNEWEAPAEPADEREPIEEEPEPATPRPAEEPLLPADLIGEALAMIEEDRARAPEPVEIDEPDDPAEQAAPKKASEPLFPGDVVEEMMRLAQDDEPIEDWKPPKRDDGDEAPPPPKVIDDSFPKDVLEAARDLERALRDELEAPDPDPLDDHTS